MSKDQPDINGISSSMLDCMLGIIAEGFTTGQSDMRHLMYCAYREARKIQIYDVERITFIDESNNT